MANHIAGCCGVSQMGASEQVAHFMAGTVEINPRLLILSRANYEAMGRIYKEDREEFIEVVHETDTTIWAFGRVAGARTWVRNPNPPQVRRNLPRAETLPGDDIPVVLTPAQEAHISYGTLYFRSYAHHSPSVGIVYGVHTALPDLDIGQSRDYAVIIGALERVLDLKDSQWESKTLEMIPVLNRDDSAFLIHCYIALGFRPMAEWYNPGSHNTLQLLIREPGPRKVARR
jgi:hypothetical protein